MIEGPDILHQTTVNLTRDALRTVFQTDHPRFRSVLGNFAERLDSESMDIRTDTIPDHVPTAVDLRLQAYHLDADHVVIKPVIVVDADRVFTKEKDEFASDMARTIFIAGQYPVNGFQRSMVEVYGEAFEKQAAFLDINNIREVACDPRYQKSGELFKELYSGPRYFFDPSFEMYQEQLLRMVEQENIDQDVVVQLLKGESYFVEARHLTQQKYFDVIDIKSYDEGDRQRCRQTAAAAVASEAVRLFGNGVLTL